MKRQLATAVALVALAVPSASSAAAPGEYPWAKRLKLAKEFAAQRTGKVSIGIVDEDKHFHGHHSNRRYSSASTVKVMLMVAYLRQARNRGLNDHDRHLLAPMIKHSSNPPANEIYLDVGPGALNKLARDAAMKGFSTGPTWGSSRIAPGSQARFFYELERYIPERHVDYALKLMADIVSRQHWGIPPAVPQGWRIHFKGGWAPEAAGWKINQVALLTNGDRRLSLAVLTRGNPSKGYGQATIRGVAERLLNGYE